MLTFAPPPPPLLHSPSVIENLDRKHFKRFSPLFSSHQRKRNHIRHQRHDRKFKTIFLEKKNKLHDGAYLGVVGHDDGAQDNNSHNPVEAKQKIFRWISVRAGCAFYIPLVALPSDGRSDHGVMASPARHDLARPVKTLGNSRNSKQGTTLGFFGLWYHTVG